MSFPPWAIKERGKGGDKITFCQGRSAVGLGTELSLLLYRCSLQVSWKVASALWKARVLPVEAPSRANCVCAGSRAWSLTGLLVVILITIVFVLLH